MINEDKDEIDPAADFDTDILGHLWLIEQGQRVLPLPPIITRCYVDPYDVTCGIFEVANSDYEPVLKTYFPFDNEVLIDWDDIAHCVIHYTEEPILKNHKVNRAIKLFCKRSYLNTMNSASRWKNNMIVEEDDDARNE